MKEKLTKEECLNVLDMYKDWNLGQKSILPINNGGKQEESILDARRALILAATKRLKEFC